MSMSQTPSEACCNTPVAVVKGYEPKGTYIEVDGMKTYTTGPASATKGLIIVYDIFGFFPQTIQGADILSDSDKKQEYQVFMPDFFEGSPADISWYPPNTPEKGEKLGNFFKTTAAPPKTVPRVSKVVKELSSRYTQIEKWGILGLCWGGKIVNLTCQEGSPFTAAVAAHPAMVDPEDAKKLSIPIRLMPSKDEDKQAVEAYTAVLQERGVKHEVQWYHDQVHGFMGARGDLTDANVKKNYEEAYESVLHWFHQNLQ